MLLIADSAEKLGGMSTTSVSSSGMEIPKQSKRRKTTREGDEAVVYSCTDANHCDATFVAIPPYGRIFLLSDQDTAYMTHVVCEGDHSLVHYFWLTDFMRTHKGCVNRMPRGPRCEDVISNTIRYLEDKRHVLDYDIKTLPIEEITLMEAEMKTARDNDLVSTMIKNTMWLINHHQKKGEFFIALANVWHCVGDFQRYNPQEFSAITKESMDAAILGAWARLNNRLHDFRKGCGLTDLQASRQEMTTLCKCLLQTPSIPDGLQNSGIDVWASYKSSDINPDEGTEEVWPDDL